MIVLMYRQLAEQSEKKAVQYSQPKEEIGICHRCLLPESATLLTSSPFKAELEKKEAVKAQKEAIPGSRKKLLKQPRWRAKGRTY